MGRKFFVGGNWKCVCLSWLYLFAFSFPDLCLFMYDVSLYAPIDSYTVCMDTTDLIDIHTHSIRCTIISLRSIRWSKLSLGWLSGSSNFNLKGLEVWNLIYVLRFLGLPSLTAVFLVSLSLSHREVGLSKYMCVWGSTLEIISYMRDTYSRQAVDQLFTEADNPGKSTGFKGPPP